MPRITVLKSSISKPAGKNYEACELGYKTDEGKVKAMKILSFVAPDVFKVAQQATPGDVMEANFQQNQKGFWEFSSLVNTGAKEATGEAKAQSAGGSSTRGNWETSEERAMRQVMIVRQSSLSNAIAFLAARNPKGITEEVGVVVDVAKRFEHYVLDKPQITGEVE